MIWPNPFEPNGVPSHSRLCRALWLAVREKPPFSVTASSAVASVAVGNPLPIKVRVQRHWPEAKVPINVIAMPVPPAPGVTFNGNNQPVVIAADKDEADLAIQFAANAQPGTYTLNLVGVGNIPFNKDPKAPQKPPVLAGDAATPIRVNVFNSVATVTVFGANVAIQPGGQAEVLVRVQRLNDYQGPLKLTLVLPQGFVGVTAPEVTIPAGASEARFVLQSPANAAPVMNPNLIIRATAVIGPTTLTADAKLTVAIVK